MFGGLKDAILSVDNDIQVLGANKKIKNICGFSPEKIIGKNIIEIKSLYHKSCIYVLKKTLRTKSAISDFRSECMHHDQPGQIVLLTGSSLKDHEDKVWGAVLVIRDITHLNILEGKLKD